MAPFTQAVVPAAHTPKRPVLHKRPPPGFPSSATPSQSSSSPLQSSAEGKTVCWQTTCPPTHAFSPASHTPAIPVLHAAPPPGFPLSATPSQSSSSPLQSSAEGKTVCWQTTCPPTHAFTPASHTPAIPVLHAAPPPGFPLSATPSQSSSSPLQSSAEGKTVCWQTTCPPTHAFTPASHTPAIPVLHAAPPPGFPLSATPSQSSSSPLQSSAEGKTVCWQTTCPPTHAFTPASHTP